MADKTLTEDEVVARLDDGMTIAIGGWGPRRKPMSLVRAIARSGLRDLTVISYGGPDVGLLCAVDKIRTLIFSFVSLDFIPLEPHFRRARERGAFDTVEMDEGMMLLGLQAAAWRVPFLPTPVGLGSDVFRVHPGLQTVRSPYADADGEHQELVAVPALRPDVALLHVDRADHRGNGQVLGVDPYFDQLMSEAAATTYLSCDELVPTAELTAGHDVRTLVVNRLDVSGVVHAPGGAHPTSCEPGYRYDEAYLREYAATAADPEAWQAFRAEWLDCDEAEYQQKVGLR